MPVPSGQAPTLVVGRTVRTPSFTSRKIARDQQLNRSLGYVGKLRDALDDQQWLAVGPVMRRVCRLIVAADRRDGAVPQRTRPYSAVRRVPSPPSTNPKDLIEAGIAHRPHYGRSPVGADLGRGDHGSRMASNRRVRILARRCCGKPARGRRQPIANITSARLRRRRRDVATGQRPVWPSGPPWSLLFPRRQLVSLSPYSLDQACSRPCGEFVPAAPRARSNRCRSDGRRRLHQLGAAYDPVGMVDQIRQDPEFLRREQRLARLQVTRAVWCRGGAGPHISSGWAWPEARLIRARNR